MIFIVFQQVQLHDIQFSSATLTEAIENNGVNFVADYLLDFYCQVSVI